MSTVFREVKPVVEGPEGKDPQEIDHGPDIEELVPVEGGQDILDALGVEENVKALSNEDYQDLQELGNYLTFFLDEIGLSKNAGGVRRGLELLKKEAGLHEDADPQAVIKKIGGIARSWKELSFVRNIEERKEILVKLISARSKREMDKIVFEEMERRHVWE